MKNKPGRRTVPPREKITSGTVCMSLEDWVRLDALAEKAGVSRGVIVSRMMKGVGNDQA